MPSPSARGDRHSVPGRDLTAVTDPKGVATPTAGDYTTTYTYDGYGQMLTAKDAANTTTTYSDYEPAGYPRTTKDALDKTSPSAAAARAECNVERSRART